MLQTLIEFFQFLNFSKKKLNKEKASLILAGSSDDKVFFVNNGMVLRTLYELRDALNTMSHETFTYHTNQDRNDFSLWVKDVHNDHDLANDLLKVANKSEAIALVNLRLAYLEKFTK